ncbi:MAG: hypothetical protein JSW61_00865 [Candidatus Thorarchaeota archaeon]|nr:MAG: hypothetical protein JSW61_00865 [Candidatus Thorarchaeota archaeon]
MGETRSALIRLVFQFFLAILQALAAIGLMAYLLETSPTFGTGGDAMLLFLLSIIFFALLHSVYRVVDGILVWRSAKAKIE